MLLRASGVPAAHTTSIGDKITSLTQLRSAAKRNSDEQERLLKLYWNRAELKKALGGLDDQLHQLQDRLKQQEAATQRAIDERDALETLLGNPELGTGALVHFQLRGLWRACHMQLQQFASELRRQQQERERKRALAEFQQERLASLRLAEQRLAEASRALDAEAAQLAAVEQRLAAAQGLWHYFARRGLREQQARQSALTLQARGRLEDMREAQRTIEKEPLPEFGGLSLEGRRAINIAVIAYAQMLYAMLAGSGLAERARRARTRSIHESDYGARPQCEALMVEIAAAAALVHSKQDFFAEIRTRTDELRRAANYRQPADPVPEPGSLPPALRGAATGGREANVLSDDYWDVYAALLT